MNNSEFEIQRTSFHTDEVVGAAQVVVPHRDLESFMSQLCQRYLVEELLQNKERPALGPSLELSGPVWARLDPSDFS